MYICISLSLYIYIYMHIRNTNTHMCIYIYIYETLIELKLCNSNFFELGFVSFNFDKRLSVEQFEPTVSQSTVPSPLFLNLIIDM